jgi:hypothetical protein
MGNESKSKESKNKGCLMGSNWWIYIICIIVGIAFIILLLWASSYWCYDNNNISDTLTPGKSILQQFSKDCVDAVKY